MIIIGWCDVLVLIDIIMQQGIIRDPESMMTYGRSIMPHGNTNP